MRPIYETCRLRPEVLQGELREEEFAARLSWALSPAPSAPAVYVDPALFFSRTFATGGLRTLLHDVLGRLSGRDSSAPAIIRLETGFGGGKTHNLIALAHAVSRRVPEDLIARFVSPDRLPNEPVRVAAVVGEDLSPASGIRHEDGVTTWTPWGARLAAGRPGGLPSGGGRGPWAYRAGCGGVAAAH
jgi:hypothetical protein